MSIISWEAEAEQLQVQIKPREDPASENVTFLQPMMPDLQWQVQSDAAAPSAPLTTLEFDHLHAEEVWSCRFRTVL